MPEFPYRTVLCDVDGTLIDSNDAHADAWARALIEHGIDVRVSDVRRLIGMGDDIGLVVATSADEREMRAILQQAGLEDLFSAHTTKDDAAESKPDPDIVLAALARVGARPESAVMVGDTPYDIEAAHRAGVVAIALRCGGYWTDADLRGAIEIFDDPAAMLTWWRRAEDRS